MRPPGSHPRARRLRGPLLSAGGVGGLALALHLRDPHASGSWGVCPWLLLTGHFCPGCGGLRAVHDLTDGDLVAAASSNVLVVAMVPLLVLAWLRWTRRSWTGEERVAVRTAVASRGDVQVWAIGLATVVMVAFAVLRNLPAGSWLAP